MPLEVGERYWKLSSLMSDADGDNIPDIIQNESIQGLKELFKLAKGLSISNEEGNDFRYEQFVAIKVEDRNIIINGWEFSDVNEIPQEIRKIYDLVVRKSESEKYVNRGISPRQGNIIISPRNQSQQEETIPPVEIPLLHDSNDYFNNNISITILLILIVIVICGAAVWFVTNGVLPDFQIIP
jgi:hypothetical protein